MMQYFYQPAVYRNFKERTESYYIESTSNLTASVSNRLDGFETILQANSLKVAGIVRDLYDNGAKFPYQVLLATSDNCTSAVP